MTEGCCRHRSEVRQAVSTSLIEIGEAAEWKLRPALLLLSVSTPVGVFPPSAPQLNRYALRIFLESRRGHAFRCVIGQLTGEIGRVRFLGARGRFSEYVDGSMDMRWSGRSVL